MKRNIYPSLEAECMVVRSTFVFFAPKMSEVEPIGLHFGPLMWGIGAHSHNFFGMWEILVTR